MHVPLFLQGFGWQSSLSASQRDTMVMLLTLISAIKWIMVEKPTDMTQMAFPAILTDTLETVDAIKTCARVLAWIGGTIIYI